MRAVISTAAMALAIAAGSFLCRCAEAIPHAVAPDSAAQSDIEKLAAGAVSAPAKAADQDAGLLKDPCLCIPMPQFGLDEQEEECVAVLGQVPKSSPTDVRRKCQSEIMDKLGSIASKDANFFDQLELSIANRYFTAMKNGADGMLNTDGDPVINSVDTFHNFADEFLRAMDQFEHGLLPATSDYGQAANQSARQLKTPMSVEQLKKSAKRIRTDVQGLKTTANATPGLQDISYVHTSKLPRDEFIVYAQRVDANIQVLIGNVGLGPAFTPAKAEADAVRNALVKLIQATNGLDVTDEKEAAEAWKEFDKWMTTASEAAKSLGRNAQAWRNPQLGNRGPLAVSRLAELAKASRTARTSTKIAGSGGR
jgi:hypothetical protein